MSQTVTASPQPRPLREGMVVAERLTLVRTLGVGGMGQVWLARHTNLDRLVAVKVLHPATHEKEHHRERFRREARAAGRLDHPGIVQPLDFGTLEDGRDFLVLEYVDGRTLHRLLKAQSAPFGWRAVVRIGTQVADALGHTHGQGVIHRDLKPDNLIVEGGDPLRGRTRILDLGLAHFDRPAGDDRHTDPRLVLGSVAFAPPEQLNRKAVDPRADIYSLGAVLFVALTGRRPFPGPGLEEVLRQQRKGAPALAEICPGTDRPVELDALISAMVECDPSRRPSSVLDVAAALHSISIRSVPPPDCAATESTGSPAVPIARLRCVALATAFWVTGVGCGLALAWRLGP